MSRAKRFAQRRRFTSTLHPANAFGFHSHPSAVAPLNPPNDGGLPMTAPVLRRAACALVAAFLLAGASPASSASSYVTPDIAKAKAEKLVVFYTSVDVSVAERLARDFEAKYGIKVQV